MKKTVAVMSCVMMIGLFGIAVDGVKGDDELCIPLGTITLSPPDDVEAKRAPVEFPHAVHFDYSCKQCHHEWTGDTEDLTCMASGCHDSATSLLKTEPDEAYRYYKTAYHNQCVVCHKEIKAANEKLEMSKFPVKGTIQKTGPVGCVECHPKE